MKLRIQGNSLRLRLKQNDIDAFAAEGKVEDRLALTPHNSLVYGLAVSAGDHVEVSYEGHDLTVHVPRPLADQWTLTERVGFEATLDVAGQTLDVLVEKDFRCLHKRPGEDESESYPHPAEAPKR